MNPLVSIVIPTWQGADVIADAIACAQAQTVGDLEIIVAIDKCDDATSELVRDAAALDSRIRVLEHTARCGWVRNVNAALDLVRGDTFFLYFHDDIIQETYVQQLTDVLERNPRAMSAFCAVEQDSGESVYVDRGRTYTGDPLTRMLDRLLLPQAGAPFRALTRRGVLDRGLRLPEGSLQGFHAQQAYLFDLIGRADSIYLDEPLYRRRNWRPGALTRGWVTTPVASLAADLKLAARSMAATASSVLGAETEMRLAEAAIGLHLLPLLRRMEINQHSERLVPAGEFFLEPSLEHRFPERWSAHARSRAGLIAELETQWQQGARPSP